MSQALNMVFREDTDDIVKILIFNGSMEPKTCQCCGKKHNYIPLDAKTWEDEEMKLVNKPCLIGWLFECSQNCKTTIFVKNPEYDLRDVS